MKTIASKTYSIFAGAAVLLSVSSGAFAVPGADMDAHVQTLEAAAGGAVDVSRSNINGKLNFLSTDQKHPILLNVLPGANAEERAQAFMSDYGKAFGLGVASQLRATKVSGKDETGMEHVRLQQLHKGVPVTVGEITVHLRGNSVVSVLAKTLPDLDSLDVTPQISAEDAKRTVHDLLNKLGIDGAHLSQPRLEIFNKGMLDDKQQASHLAWFITAKKIDVRRFIWVDAQRGAVLLHFSQLPDARNRKIYDTNNSNVLPGTLVRSEGGAATGDADADKAYDYSGDTYNYFKNVHARDSYDGAGAPLISTTHYCPESSSCPYQNAFWNGTQMVYGEGFSAADDVDAHELTHAVTEYSANLFYYMQSGALNESFSDIFGETVDLTNKKGTDTAAVRWKMGEDVPGIGVIRDMKNPGAYGDPAKVKDTNFKCNPSTGIFDDQGGVHSNSGVPNHAYALMVDGGTYNGQTITGIGLTKAGKIQYRALTKYLTSGSNFLDNFNALKQSCTDLIGTAGITAADCSQVTKAITAVQMNAPVCSKPLAPALCPAGTTVKNLFLDGLEGGSTKFVFSDTTVWSRLNLYAKTGKWHIDAWPLGSAGDTNTKMASNIVLPAGAKMQFDHSFEFERNSFDATLGYDGGIVEYSTNNGATWIDAAALMTKGLKYNGTISSSYGNPLGGKSAFVGESSGYSATQLDLSSLAGKSVRFRFRIGSDSEVRSFGWDIDNLRVYQCQ